MANGSIKKGIAKVSTAISLPAKPESEQYIDTSITLSDIPSGAYLISLSMHQENSSLNYMIPYFTTTGASVYVYRWTSSTKILTIRNLGVAWTNYVLEAIFLIP